MSSLKKVWILPAIFVAVMIAQYLVLTDRIEEAMRSSLTGATQASNATVTRLFVNEVYPKADRILQLSSNATVKDKLDNDELAKLDTLVRSFIFGSDVLKVKIYNKRGITLYSTDFSQIGDDKSKSLPFLAAVQGMPASQITHRGQFEASEGEVYNRDLVSSYIPIRAANNTIIGVAELYADRTPAIRTVDSHLDTLSAQLLLSISVAIILMLGMLWVLMQRNQQYPAFEESIEGMAR